MSKNILIKGILLRTITSGAGGSSSGGATNPGGSTGTGISTADKTQLTANTNAIKLLKAVKHYKGTFVDVAARDTAVTTPADGDYVLVGAGPVYAEYIYDTGKWNKAGSTSSGVTLDYATGPDITKGTDAVKVINTVGLKKATDAIVTKMASAKADLGLSVVNKGGEDRVIAENRLTSLDEHGAVRDPKEEYDLVDKKYADAMSWYKGKLPNLVSDAIFTADQGGAWYTDEYRTGFANSFNYPDFGGTGDGAYFQIGLIGTGGKIIVYDAASDDQYARHWNAQGWVENHNAPQGTPEYHGWTKLLSNKDIANPTDIIYGKKNKIVDAEQLALSTRFLSVDYTIAGNNPTHAEMIAALAKLNAKDAIDYSKSFTFYMRDMPNNKLAVVFYEANGSLSGDYDHLTKGIFWYHMQGLDDHAPGGASGSSTLATQVADNTSEIQKDAALLASLKSTQQNDHSKLQTKADEIRLDFLPIWVADDLYEITSRGLLLKATGKTGSVITLELSVGGTLLSDKDAEYVVNFMASKHSMYSCIDWGVINTDAADTVVVKVGTKTYTLDPAHPQTYDTLKECAPTNKNTNIISALKMARIWSVTGTTVFDVTVMEFSTVLNGTDTLLPPSYSPTEPSSIGTKKYIDSAISALPSPGISQAQRAQLDSNTQSTANNTQSIVGVGSKITHLETSATATDLLVAANKLAIDNLKTAGVQGAPGTQGIQGVAGPAGGVGPAGANGAQGIQGLVGPSGAAGTNGAIGHDGPKGDAGTAGATGPASTTPGPKGDTGAAGTPGLKGGKGDAGSAGPIGHTGPASVTPGPKGSAGAKGDTGAVGGVGPAGGIGKTGPAGKAGTNGVVGHTGPQGLKGDRGLGVTIHGSATHAVIVAKTGAPGDVWIATDGTTKGHGFVSDGAGAGATHWTDIGSIRGDKGDAGSKGATGHTGPVSVTPGPAGGIGKTGPAGGTGAAGAPGHKGDKGDDGAKGTTGAPGHVGAAGAKGDKGDAGPKGSTGHVGAASVVAGPKGATGGVGPKGSTGAAGKPGATGHKGDIGLTGHTGAASTAVGPRGATGAAGKASVVAGPKGATGGVGGKGPKGDKGTAGGRGPTGAKGSSSMHYDTHTKILTITL